MKVKSQRMGTVEVIIPDGPITDEEGDELLDVVNAQFSTPQPNMVIAMQEVPYMDSHGLELLLSFAQTLRDRSMPLKLVGITPTCREILDLTELTGEFEIFDDVENAVRSFL